MISIRNGKRHVAPYEFDYRANTKKRWVGRTILDVMSSEFVLEERDYFEKAIKSGKILVNGKRVDASYVLKHCDAIVHKVIREEPDVPADIDIIRTTDEIIAVNKPSGIPVHACGRFFHNCLQNVVEEKLRRKLYALNRLDLPTSGLVFFGLTADVATRFSAEVNGAAESHKEYLCLVNGRFPDSVVVEEPLRIISFKLGMSMVSRDAHKAKQSKTRFELVKYVNGKSLVRCMLYTGRTHQIRVHLRWLGFPIANDSLYKCEYLWGCTNDIIEDADMNKRCQEYLEQHGRDMPLNSSEIYLHSYRYSVFGETYEAPLPYWADSLLHGDVVIGPK